MAADRWEGIAAKESSKPERKHQDAANIHTQIPGCKHQNANLYFQSQLATLVGRTFLPDARRAFGRPGHLWLCRAGGEREKSQNDRLRTMPGNFLSVR